MPVAMVAATHKQITALFPGIQDHAAIEILATRATIDDLEAASLLMQDADEGTIDIRRREGDRINRVLDILARSELRLLEDDH